MKITALSKRRHRLTAVYFGDFAKRWIPKRCCFPGFGRAARCRKRSGRALKRPPSKNRAYEKALYLLEYRAHTKSELFTKLRTAFPSEVCEHALCRIERLGLCDDEAFARDFADELFNRKGFGKRRVAFELQKKGVDRDIIDEVLCEYEDSDPVEAIAAVINKNTVRSPRTIKNSACLRRSCPHGIRLPRY